MSFMEKNEGPNPTLFQLFSSEIRFWRVIARIHKPLVTGVRVSIPFIGPVGFVLNSTCKIRYFARGKLELVAASERLTRPRGRAAPTYGCTERVCHGFATAQPRNHNISILSFESIFLTSTTSLATCSHTKWYATATIFCLVCSPGLLNSA